MLLNSLNGIYEPAECLVIMTTNHAEVLDPALIRSGRIDKSYYVHNPNWLLVSEFISKFFKVEYNEIMKYINEEDVSTPINYSMALVQNTCLQNETARDWKNVINILKIKTNN
jgi:ATP-dependent 26S proteasome regulatory subunit